MKNWHTILEGKPSKTNALCPVIIGLGFQVPKTLHATLLFQLTMVCYRDNVDNCLLMIVDVTLWLGPEVPIMLTVAELITI